jgi:Winged helix-turn helix
MGSTPTCGTLERVAVVICQQTGVRNHPGHVWVILRHRLGWTLQRPERQASERDQEAIARRVAQEWPRIKTGPPQHRPGLSSSTNRPSPLIPPVRRTWSPGGRTPILRHRFGWKKASMAAALGYRPDATAARLWFHLQQPSSTTDRLITVLEQLAMFYAGHKIVLLWEGLSATGAPRCGPSWTASATGCAWSGYPADAPERNPVEACGPTPRTRAGQPADDHLAEVADATEQASNESASTTAWRSDSWPTPASPGSMNRQPNP